MKMDLITNLLGGFAQALSPEIILFMFAGTALGCVIGFLPGMGASTGTSILLPLTFGLHPICSLCMLVGVYFGTQYGGSISAIMLNVPGTSSAAITCIDGYPMFVQGRGGKAFGAGQFCSCIGSVISTLGLAIFGMALARYALRFSTPEYFSMTLMGLALTASLTGNSPSKGFLMMLFGMATTCIGVDSVTGVNRFTFGNIYLSDGINTVPILLGMMGFAELLNTASKGIQDSFASVANTKIRTKDLLLDKQDWKLCLPASLRSSVIGFITGALPGAGATIAGVLSYGVQKKFTKSPDFGNGAVDGVAAAEAANNASTGGAMVPMLALGIPGSPTTAVLLTALTMFGLRPGPMFYTTNGDMVWTLIAAMLIGNIFALIFDLGFIPICMRIMGKIQSYLIPSVACLCFLGAYSLYTRTAEIWIMLVFAVFGYLVRKFNMPVLPFILGAVLGDMVEGQFRQSLVLSGGSYSIFFTRPWSCAMLVVAIIAMVLPMIRRKKA